MTYTRVWYLWFTNGYKYKAISFSFESPRGDWQASQIIQFCGHLTHYFFLKLRTQSHMRIKDKLVALIQSSIFNIQLIFQVSFCSSSKYAHNLFFCVPTTGTGNWLLLKVKRFHFGDSSMTTWGRWGVILRHSTALFISLAMLRFTFKIPTWVTQCNEPVTMAVLLAEGVHSFETFDTSTSPESICNHQNIIRADHVMPYSAVTTHTHTHTHRHTHLPFFP